MPRSLASLGLLLLALSSCSLWGGRGWGEADVTIDVRFAPDDTRLTDEGYLKTSRDYAVEIQTFDVQLEAIELVIADEEEAGELSFDPASPPPGYSLCHNGHCHSDSGDLVDYADIEAELAGATAAGAASYVLSTATDPVPVSTDGSAVEVLPCEGGCTLDRGVMERIRVHVASVQMAGRLYDLRTASEVRLPPEGVAFGGDPVALDIDIDVEAAIPLNGTEPPGVALALALDLTPTIFDRIGLAFFVEESFLDLNAPPGFVAADIATNLAESELRAEVSRFEVETTGPVLFPQGGNNSQGGTP